MALEDDIWAYNRLPGPKTETMTAEGSFRYADVDGVVHRALWAAGLVGVSAWCGAEHKRDPKLDKIVETSAPATCLCCIANKLGDLAG